MHNNIMRYLKFYVNKLQARKSEFAENFVAAMKETLGIFFGENRVCTECVGSDKCGSVKVKFCLDLLTLLGREGVRAL